MIIATSLEVIPDYVRTPDIGTSVGGRGLSKDDLLSKDNVRERII